MGILRFRIFGFPVSVLPGYWLLSGLLAFGWAGSSLASAALIMSCIFLSILVHELGHAFAARAFGMPAQITFHMMGGATSFPSGAQLTRGRDILISLAGPGAGLALGVVALGLMQVYGPAQWLAAATSEEGPAEISPFVLTLFWLMYLNIVYSLLNLVPVVPFDGGRILVAALGPRRVQVASTVSLLVGMLAAFAFLSMNMVLPAVLFGAAALTSFLRMRQVASSSTAQVDEDQVQRLLRSAERALHDESYDQAAQLAHQVLTHTRARESGRRALEIALWARLGAGDAKTAAALLSAAPQSTVDAYVAAAVHEAAGNLERAHELLVEARASGDERVEVTALLIKVLLGQHDFTAAARLTREIVGSSQPDDVRRVAQEAESGGAPVEAAHLHLALAEAEKSFTDAKRALYGFAAAGLPGEALRAFQLMLGLDRTQTRELLSDEQLSGMRRQLEDAVGGA